jgi:hypothetical protein
VRTELLRQYYWFESNTGSNAGSLGSVYSSKLFRVKIRQLSRQ